MLWARLGIFLGCIYVIVRSYPEKILKIFQEMYFVCLSLSCRLNSQVFLFECSVDFKSRIFLIIMIFRLSKNVYHYDFNFALSQTLYQIVTKKFNSSNVIIIYDNINWYNLLNVDSKNFLIVSYVCYTVIFKWL